MILLSGLDGHTSMVHCKPCPLYYAVVKDWGGGSLSLSLPLSLSLSLWLRLIVLLQEEGWLLSLT